MQLQIKKLTETAVVPVFAHTTDAGMDLFADEAVELKPGERVLVSTGIAMAIPEGYVGLVWDKSGLAVKRGIKTMAGVIDAGYRGEIKVALLNTTDKAQSFEIGEKVSQILIQKVEQPEMVLVDELSDTERGEGGFGSTGV
ncbi:MAG: dUTP diphosphatase [Candidatus Pacebacteria bacterium]|nr:dUTP diphosphatase [Candidatus Paceibacterota bacterium]